MNFQSLYTTSRRTWRATLAYVTKSTERKWTAAGAGLGVGAALILVPPLGLAARGGAISGRGIIALFVVMFCILAGNRLGIAFDRRKARENVK